MPTSSQALKLIRHHNPSSRPSTESCDQSEDDDATTTGGKVGGDPKSQSPGQQWLTNDKTESATSDHRTLSVSMPHGTYASHRQLGSDGPLSLSKRIVDRMAVRMQTILSDTTSPPALVGEGDRQSCVPRLHSAVVQDLADDPTEQQEVSEFGPGVTFRPNNKRDDDQGPDQMHKDAVESKDSLRRRSGDTEFCYLDKRHSRKVGWGESCDSGDQQSRASPVLRHCGREEKLTGDVGLVSTGFDDRSTTSSAVLDIPSDQFWSEPLPVSRSHVSRSTAKQSQTSLTKGATEKPRNAVLETNFPGLTVGKTEFEKFTMVRTMTGGVNERLGEARIFSDLPEEFDYGKAYSQQSVAEDFKNFINGNDIIKLSDSFLADKTFLSASCNVSDGFLNLNFRQKPAVGRSKKPFERFRLKSVSSFRNRLNVVKPLGNFNTEPDDLGIGIFNDCLRQLDYEVRGHSVTPVRLAKRSNVTRRTNQKLETVVPSNQRSTSGSNDSSLKLDTDFDVDTRDVLVLSISGSRIDNNHYFTNSSSHETKANDKSYAASSKRTSTQKCSLVVESGRRGSRANLSTSQSEWCVLGDQRPGLTLNDTIVKQGIKDEVRKSKSAPGATGNEECPATRMAKLPGPDFRFRAAGVETSAERRERREHESELGSQTKRRPDLSSRRLGDLLEAPRSATGGNADRFDRGDYRPCLPDDNDPYQKQEDGCPNEESSKLDNLTIYNGNGLCTEENDPEKKKIGAGYLHDEGNTEVSFPGIPSEESSFSKMWPNPWDWPTPVRFERPVPVRLNAFRDLTFTGMSPEDIKKSKERSKRSQEEGSGSVGVGEERAKARPWNDYLLNKFNKGVGGGGQKKKKTMKFKLAYDDANCECTLIPCQKSGHPKPNGNKTGDCGPTVEVCSGSQSDSSTDITQKQRRVTVRMRKILPPPQPKKLCFQTMLSGCTHSEVRREIETQANVKVTLLQYDPIRLQAFKNASLTEEHCCMWIFELSPASNAEPLLFEGINLRGLHMNVRPLDDVYREEHVAYTLCTEIYSEQQKKRLTQRSNLKLPRACRKRFSFK